MKNHQIQTRMADLADSPAIARIHVDSWRSTYRGIVPDSVLDSLDYESREGTWRRGIEDSTSSQRILVAESATGGLTGFAAVGPERTGDYPGYTGEIYALYVPDEWHSHGIGRALFTAAVRELVAQGHTTMLIWALTENPACRFYQHLGGIAIATQQITAGHKTLEETAFGWENIAVLIDSDRPRGG